MSEVDDATDAERGRVYPRQIRAPRATFRIPSGEIQPARAPTTWLMQPHKLATSSDSIDGNMAIRSWLRPSFLYGSVSTIPFVLRTFATIEASTASAKSIVPTTWLLSDALSTNGV